MEKKLRLSRIFREGTGNTLILPIDHGISGSKEGLEDPITVLRELSIPQVDAVLLNDGVSKQSDKVFRSNNAPGRILNSDIFNYEIESEKMIHHLTFTPEFAVRKGYDCIKLVLFWDRPAQERMRSIKLLSSVIEEADKWGMPVLIEPLLSKPVADINRRAKLLTDANRVAFELGADILKVAHPGDSNIIKEWVKYFNIPIILLGGGKSGTAKELINMVKESIHAGVNGVAIGRNIWQRPVKEARDLLATFSEIIHQQNNK